MNRVYSGRRQRPRRPSSSSSPMAMAPHRRSYRRPFALEEICTIGQTARPSFQVTPSHSNRQLSFLGQTPASDGRTTGAASGAAARRPDGTTAEGVHVRPSVRPPRDELERFPRVAQMKLRMQQRNDMRTLHCTWRVQPPTRRTGWSARHATTWVVANGTVVGACKLHRIVQFWAQDTS